MSLEVAKEMAAYAYDLFTDAIIDFMVRHKVEPTVVYVSQAMEGILSTHLALNCNVQLPPGGVRGMAHVMGMRPVWNALHFKLEREECPSTRLPAPTTTSSDLSFSISVEVLPNTGSSAGRA